MHDHAGQHIGGALVSDRPTRGPRPARYAPAGVVVLSPQDAFHVVQLLDETKVRRARNGTLESPIGSLQALVRAADDWATFTRESTPAGTVKADGPLKQPVTPRWIADRLNCTVQAVTLAANTGRIPGAEQIDGRWSIPYAGYEHYRQHRSK